MEEASPIQNTESESGVSRMSISYLDQNTSNMS